MVPPAPDSPVCARKVLALALAQALGLAGPVVAGSVTRAVPAGGTAVPRVFLLLVCSGWAVGSGCSLGRLLPAVCCPLGRCLVCGPPALPPGVHPVRALISTPNEMEPFG